MDSFQGKVEVRGKEAPEHKVFEIVVSRHRRADLGRAAGLRGEGNEQMCQQAR